MLAMRALAVASVLTLAAFFAACGGGSSSTSSPTTSSQTLAPAFATTASGAPKSATPPAVTNSVAATAPGEIPTAPPVAVVGTPAVKPGDQAAFLAQFQGVQTDLQSCSYNPGTALADCSSVQYAIDPPIVGQDIQCTLWLVSGTPRALACGSQEPAQTNYYEVQQ
jgi:hypothetical protein